MHTFLFLNMNLNMYSEKCQLFCSSLSVLQCSFDSSAIIPDRLGTGTRVQDGACRLDTIF